jgi:DNA-directed RNA polymerase specialized sigma24 family protein
LDELRQFDPHLAEVVMLRYFTGLSVDETAAAMDRSPRSVKSDWSVARAWLLRRMKPPDE